MRVSCALLAINLEGFAFLRQMGPPASQGGAFDFLDSRAMELLEFDNLGPLLQTKMLIPPGCGMLGVQKSGQLWV